MKIVFMGTPEFAVPSLKALVENHYDVVAVITQMDKPAGRGHVLKAPPVKEYALSKGIVVIQPEKLSRQPDVVDQLARLQADLFVTCAFGQILPKSVLDIPKLGTINVHGSLLPKYRGAAPIQWSIINGEHKTGITTMYTDIGMDTGDMLLKEEIIISQDMTAGELHDKMSLLGADILIKTIKALEMGQLDRVKQDDSQATYAPRITKDTGLIDWNKDAKTVHNLVRGTTPWPGAFTYLGCQKVRVWRTELTDTKFSPDNTHTRKPGEILNLDCNGMLVKTGCGNILIKELQVDANKRMTPWQYCCGHELCVGTVLGGN